MGLYQDLQNRDIVDTLKGLVQENILDLQADGTFTLNYKVGLESPWVFVKQDENRRCDIWHRIVYGKLGILPYPCLQCWKVVVRPRNLDEHFELWEIQKDLGRPSKLGMEVRPSVCGLWGGYFYNDSLQEGAECWKEVREAVSGRISEDVPVILKRGCTEFEHSFGPSDHWDDLITDDVRRTCDIVANAVVPTEKLKQLDFVADHTVRNWIQWAYQNGDMTYLNYTDGKPLYSPYVQYQVK